MMRVCSGGRETWEDTMVYTPTPLSSNKNRCVFFFFNVSAAAAAALESMIWAVPIFLLFFLIDFLTSLYLVSDIK
jgi:hypothetical protein